MSCFCIGTPPQRVIPASEYHLTMDEDRFFLPGIIHGGDYLIHVYAYHGDDCDKIDANCVTADDILTAKRLATTSGGTFYEELFFNILNEITEHFICMNLPDDPCFAAINKNWESSSNATAKDLIAWAKAHS